VIAQTRAELLKIRSTRTTVGLVLGMLGLILLFSLLTGLLTKAPHLATRDQQRTLFNIGSLSGLFSVLAGTLLITSEFRYGTIRPTFLFTPKRWRVIVPKLIAGALAGLALAVVGELAGLGLGYATLAARGISSALTGADLVLLAAGTLVAVTLWGAIGVAIGAVVRNQVGAIIGILAWLFIAESLLFAFVPAVGRYTPSEAEDALVGLKAAHLLSPGAGAAVLVAWTIGFAVAAVAATNRRDVG
jgi:ABC-2 type transport system permease protein